MRWTMSFWKSVLYASVSALIAGLWYMGLEWVGIFAISLGCFIINERLK